MGEVQTSRNLSVACKGTSEWTPQQIQEAVGLADRLNLIPPVVEQPEYNLFNRTKVRVTLNPKPFNRTKVIVTLAT